MTGSMDSTFHEFSRLPLELRLAIWRLCLPHRVYELDVLLPAMQYYDKKPPCYLSSTSRANALPPVITHVCHEARSVALETGRPDYLHDEQCPEDFVWDTATTKFGEDSWLDNTRDSVHLNWSLIHEVPYGGDSEDQENLRCLDWYAGRSSGKRSLNLDYLEDQIAHAAPDARARNREEVREILENSPEWLVVVKVIVVHAEATDCAEAGLFGLLGDARVQIIDATDEQQVTRYLDMAKDCERDGSPPLERRQDLQLDTLEEMRAHINKVWLEQYGAPQLKTDLRPAIMFRLCNAACNFPTVESKKTKSSSHNLGKQIIDAYKRILQA